MAAAKRQLFAARGNTVTGSALLCTHCDEDKEVQWKCNDCGGEYCSKCKRIHLIADEGCHNHDVVRYGSRRSKTSCSSASFDSGSNSVEKDNTVEERETAVSNRRIHHRVRGYSLPTSSVDRDDIGQNIHSSRGGPERENTSSSDGSTVRDSDFDGPKQNPHVGPMRNSFECSFGMADNKTVQQIKVQEGNCGNAWIKCGIMSDDLVLASSHGAKVEIVKVKGCIQDFALTRRGEILFSMYNSFTIWRYGQNENICPFADVPFKPGPICVTRTNDILVAASQPAPEPITKLSERAQKVDFRPSNVPGNLNQVYNMTENINGDIIIAEKGGWGSGRVLALKSGGDFKFKYQSTGSIDPSGITCDKHGFIYICDLHLGNVHVLDADGNFVSYLLPSETLLKSPESIAVDSDGLVWIGDGEGIVRLFQLRYS